MEFQNTIRIVKLFYEDFKVKLQVVWHQHRGQTRMQSQKTVSKGENGTGWKFPKKLDDVVFADDRAFLSSTTQHIRE